MNVRPRQLVFRLERSDIHPLSVYHQTSTPEFPLHLQHIVPEPKATFQMCEVSSRGGAYASTDGPWAVAAGTIHRQHSPLSGPSPALLQRHPDHKFFLGPYLR